MRHAFREALNGIQRAPLLTALSAAMVGLALFVVGLFGVAAYNLTQALETIEERVQIVVYLRDDARQVDVIVAQEELRDLAQVRDVRLVTKDQALEAARRDLPEFADVFGDLEVNPLPASLEIQLREEARTENSLVDVAHQAQLYPFVEEVQYGREWVERLFLLQRIAGVTTLVLGSAFAVVAALIIGTAIRISIFARREEISIMRLVGARNGFIRAPFLIEGLLTGILGGLLAALLTYAAFRAVHDFLFELMWIPASWTAGGLGFGALFGTLASALALRRYLREV